MKKQYVYSLIALVALVCYYYGLTLIQIPQGEEWSFLFLILGGYSILGFVFGILFSRDVLTNFMLVFALGFLGGVISVISYRAFIGLETFLQTLQNSTGYLIASFLMGISAAFGTLVSALLVWILRRRAGKADSKEHNQTSRPS